MLNRMPTPKRVITNEVPPKLRKGRGRPVIGRRPTTIPTFTTACVTMRQVIPRAR